MPLPRALPSGELANEVSLRGLRVTLSVTASAVPPLPKGEALAKTEGIALTS